MNWDKSIKVMLVISLLLASNADADSVSQYNLTINKRISPQHKAQMKMCDEIGWSTDEVLILKADRFVLAKCNVELAESRKNCWLVAKAFQQNSLGNVVVF